MVRQSSDIVYHFGNFTLDVRARSLTHAGEAIPLSPKEFLTLQLLVEQAGSAVSREFLVNSIWPDTVVGETSLGRNISALRRHLGQEAIKSVPKFGYRFQPAVTSNLRAEQTVPSQTGGAASAAGRSTMEPAVAAVPPEAAAETDVLSPDADELAAGAVTGGRAALPGVRHAGRRRMFALLAVAAALGIGAWILLGPNRLSGAAVSSEAMAEARRWDDMGDFALREGTCFKASKAFQQAIALDPHAALAHVHLADAWLRLERLNDARSELLIASDPHQVRPLSGLDARYLDAVRATANREYAGATRDYQAILAGLPASTQAAGLEDLGRAYANEGRIPEAIRCYEQAARSQPADAGVYLQLGDWKGLQRDWAAADALLLRATSLYQASSNLEGLIQVNLQRGRMAYVQARYGEAETYYGKALEIARGLADPQEEARALGSLSTVERWDGKYDDSLRHATESLEINRKAGSDTGTAGSIMLLANLALARRDVARSRDLLQQALALAGKANNPRLQANAEFSTATLMDQTGDYAQEIRFARAASGHYQQYGSVDGVADAALLLVYGEAGSGEFAQALGDAQHLLESSQRTGSDLFVEDSEEEIGNIYTAEEDDPAALPHFQRALEMSRKTGSEAPLKSAEVAACLARMGRLRDAESMLASVPAAAQRDPDVSTSYMEARLAIALGQARFRDALDLSRSAEAHATTAGAALGFQETTATAEARLGTPARASDDLADLLRRAAASQNPYLKARAHLAGAMLALAQGQPTAARDLADDASAYLGAHGALKSQWVALLCKAQALRALGSQAESAAAADGARAALRQMQTQWPADAFSAYAARPDTRQFTKILSSL